MIEKIISGGQTGVDRAALDWAIANDIGHGGWCPAGHRAEDGIIPEHYSLQETRGRGYSERTRWNVRDSDATLIISSSPELSGGSLATKQYANKMDRPCLHIYPGDEWDASLRGFIKKHPIHILNVAGPRGSAWANPGPFVHEVLDKISPNCKHLGKRTVCMDNGQCP